VSGCDVDEAARSDPEYDSTMTWLGTLWYVTTHRAVNRQDDDSATARHPGTIVPLSVNLTVPVGPTAEATVAITVTGAGPRTSGPVERRTIVLGAARTSTLRPWETPDVLGTWAAGGAGGGTGETFGTARPT
jgi:hypothetical protein